MKHFFSSFSWFLSKLHLKGNDLVKYLLVAAAASEQKHPLLHTLNRVSVVCGSENSEMERRATTWMTGARSSVWLTWLSLSVNNNSARPSCLHSATLSPFRPRVSFFCVDGGWVFYTGRCPGRINATGLFFTAAADGAEWLFGSDPATTLSDNNAVASSLLPFNFHPFLP